MKDGWELMPGRNGGEYGCGRFNMGLAEKAGLMPHSTLMLYDSIEGEPSPPNTKLQFEDIRRALQQEDAIRGYGAWLFRQLPDGDFAVAEHLLLCSQLRATRLSGQDGRSRA